MEPQKQKESLVNDYIITLWLGLVEGKKFPWASSRPQLRLHINVKKPPPLLPTKKRWPWLSRTTTPKKKTKK